MPVSADEAADCSNKDLVLRFVDATNSIREEFVIQAQQAVH